MRKYVLTDAKGVTPLGNQLQPGKLVQDSREKFHQMSRLVGCGGDTPLLAAMLSPLPCDNARLFQINCWTVSADPRQPSSYTVVKEVKPVPEAALDRKLVFALLVIKSIGGDRDFVKWADGWIAGADRSAETARNLLKAEEKEKTAADGLGELTAWGQTGTDDTRAEEMDAATGRALHLLRAAVLYENPSKARETAELIAQALSKIGNREDLEALAEQAMATGDGRPVLSESA